MSRSGVLQTPLRDIVVAYVVKQLVDCCAAALRAARELLGLQLLSSSWVVTGALVSCCDCSC